VAAVIPSGWEVAVALNRWLLYSTMLLASGSAMVLLGLDLPTPARAAARVQGRIAGSVAAIAYVLAIGLGGADALGVSLLDAKAWAAGAQTSLFPSAAAGIGAMTVLALGFTGVRAALIVGITFAVASFLVTGHPATLTPRWLADIAFILHLFGAALWLGALWPLYVTTQTAVPQAAAEVMARFSRQVSGWIAAILASGIAVGWIQLRSLFALFNSAYGIRLTVKLALVAGLLAIALHNKIILTPALRGTDDQAARRLRAHIVAELALFALILAAAVSLTLVASPAELAD
jgi:copper transport protein